jgi:Lysine-specific metallo-endopeptidase
MGSIRNIDGFEAFDSSNELSQENSNQRDELPSQEQTQPVARPSSPRPHWDHQSDIQPTTAIRRRQIDSRTVSLPITIPKHLRSNTTEVDGKAVLRAIASGARCARMAHPSTAGPSGLSTIAEDAELSVDKHSVLVQDWFGQLNQAQLATLRERLSKIESVLNNPNTSIRIVDVPNLPTEQSTNASTYLGYNVLRPVLSIQVDKDWKNTNIDNKIQILFHELSHRVLQTKDHGPKEGFPGPYGLAAAMQIARMNPDIALTNAENYGFFIAMCMGYRNLSERNFK